MNNTPTDEQIADYLRGRLVGVEREKFEQQLDADHALAQALSLARAEMAATELLLAAETRAWMRQWSRPERPPRSWVKWLIGALLTGLLVLVSARLIQKTSPPAAAPPDSMHTTLPPVAELAPPSAPARPPVSTRPNYRRLAAAALPDPLQRTLRRPMADSVASPLARAQAAYAAGQYPETLQWLEQTDSSQAQSANFLAAHSLFRLHRYAAAEARFSTLVRQNSRQYRLAAEWGLLLCQLAEMPRNEPAFRARLDSMLARPDHPYHTPAQTLSQQLGYR